MVSLLLYLLLLLELVSLGLCYSYAAADKVMHAACTATMQTARQRFKKLVTLQHNALQVVGSIVAVGEHVLEGSKTALAQGCAAVRGGVVAT
jgi:hypothetical protein